MFDDVRVIKKSEHLDLSLDLVKHPLLLYLLLVHDLDRHFMAADFIESHYSQSVNPID